jgi:S1-C subfamily serine protease
MSEGGVSFTQQQHQNPILLRAGDRESGVACPHCQVQVVRGDEVAQCPACGTVHHHGCWQAHGCGAYACAPARRAVVERSADTWRITAEDLRVTAPLPSQRTRTPSVFVPPPNWVPKPKFSRLAIAALVCAVAGIPLFGLITGIVAIVLASFALGEIHRNNARKGAGLAVSGLLLGLADVVGWLFLLSHFAGGFGGGRHGAPRLSEFRLDASQLAALPAPTARALRANVLITSHNGADTGIGSGVILRIANGQAHILTNRHVVDPSFSGDGSAVDVSSLTPVEVALIDQSRSQGRVVWLAPGLTDLAVVATSLASPEARTAAWPATRPSRVGDPVFAVGNPHALGWTHTQGSISQFRSWDDGGRHVSVIQTSTPINPGNSGGGLYDVDGYLIGINTWTDDKRVSEGLNFAISLAAFLGTAPGEFATPPATNPPPPPPALLTRPLVSPKPEETRKP